MMGCRNFSLLCTLLCTLLGARGIMPFSGPWRVWAEPTVLGRLPR